MENCPVIRQIEIWHSLWRPQHLAQWREGLSGMFSPVQNAASVMGQVHQNLRDEQLTHVERKQCCNASFTRAWLPSGRGQILTTVHTFYQLKAFGTIWSEKFSEENPDLVSSLSLLSVKNVTFLWQNWKNWGVFKTIDRCIWTVVSGAPCRRSYHDVTHSFIDLHYKAPFSVFWFWFCVRLKTCNAPVRPSVVSTFCIFY